MPITVSKQEEKTMSKPTEKFKSDVMKKLKDANTALFSQPSKTVQPGWKRDPTLKGGTIDDIELKPEFKKLIQKCGAKLILRGDSDPQYRFRHSTGEEQIIVPWPQQFENEEAFYRVLLHELGHWSGREHRLNREMGELDCCRYHSVMGAVEEITAELASVMLAEHFGFTPHYMRAVEYINGYLAHVAKNAPEDKRDLFVLASQQANDVADYITSLT
jgi:antirestriction protein ArdC